MTSRKKGYICDREKAGKAYIHIRFSGLGLSLGTPNQTDTGKEEYSAQNKVHKRGLRYTPFGEIHAAVNQANQANQCKYNTKHTFRIHRACCL